MTSFTFSADQVRSAPPEVRRWIENEVVRALRGSLDQEASRAKANELTACSFEEITRIFNMIAGNFIVAKVFFELGRETPFAHEADAPQLHALDFGDILRHTQLADAARVVDCLNLINQALQTVRNDPEATLFASDPRGHVFVHDTTSRNIRKLWEHLVASHAAQASALPAEPAGSPVFADGPAPLESGDAARPEYAFARMPGA